MYNIPKLCLQCGETGHVSGVDCPMCCSICGGETDDNNQCIEYNCKNIDRPLAQGTPLVKVTTQGI